jgi:dienelactone hydrolase
MKKVKKGLIIFSIVLVLLIVASLIYLSTGNYKSKDLAKAHMISDKNTTVIIENGIKFIPSKPNETGVILYQGAKVDISAYSIEAKVLADNGYLVFIPKMPFNMAFFGINRADKIIENNPDITSWYIAGHSLGGSMAAKYTSKNQEKIDGLILLASYSVDDLTGYKGKVISIIGSKDMGIDKEKLEETSVNLPEDTEFYIIEGGNHSQFGDYGFQKGDNIADISLEEQLELITNKMLEFLK